MPKPVLIPEVVMIIQKAQLVCRRVAVARRKGQRVILISARSSTLGVALRQTKGAFKEALAGYLRQLRKDHHRVAMFDDLKAENARMSKRLSQLMEAVGSHGVRARRTIRLFTLEAHHVIPDALAEMQSGKRSFPLIVTFFGGGGQHPAINLTAIEHRGSQKLLKALGDALGEADLGILKLAPEQSAVSVTTELNRIITKHRGLSILSLDPATERAATKAVINEIETMYKSRFPGLLEKADDTGFTLKDWFDNLRRHVDRAPHP
jgi:hypothetical protein